MQLPKSIRILMRNKFPLGANFAHDESGSNYFVRDPLTGECQVAIEDNGHGGYQDAQEKYSARFPLDLSPIPTNLEKELVIAKDKVIINESFDQEAFDRLIEESEHGFIPSIHSLRSKDTKGDFSGHVAGDVVSYGSKNAEAGASTAQFTDEELEMILRERKRKSADEAAALQDKQEKTVAKTTAAKKVTAAKATPAASKRKKR